MKYKFEHQGSHQKTLSAERGADSQQRLVSRSLDTMSDAIALSSPSGRMSKRARVAAQERLRVALFGVGGLQKPMCPQPDEKTRLLREAANLRELAARGMKARAFVKRAEELERMAANINITITNVKNANELDSFTPVPGSPETQFDGVDRRNTPFYKKLAAGMTGGEAHRDCVKEAAKSAGITSEKAAEILAAEAE